MISITTSERRAEARAANRRTALGGATKRTFDLVGASLLLVFLAPFFAVVFVLMKMFDRGNVVFSHERVGHDGMRFGCLKFRTMVVDSERVLQDLLEKDADAAAEWNATHKLRDDPRITRLGTFLRKTSLDELPQLINVLRGEMSLVGPRPVVEAELMKYGRRAQAYRRARPGLTGLWQVSGRSDTSYRRRVCLDVCYVSDWSLLWDIKILLRTVDTVLLRKGSV